MKQLFFVAFLAASSFAASAKSSVIKPAKKAKPTVALHCKKTITNTNPTTGTTTTTTYECWFCKCSELPSA